MPTTKTLARIHNLTEKQIDRKIWPRTIGTNVPRGLSDGFSKNEIKALMTHPMRPAFGRSIGDLIQYAEGVMIDEYLAS